MSVRMTGDQFKQFMHEPTVWPDDSYWEECVVTIDGEEVGEDEDPEELVKPDSKVVLTEGIIILNQSDPLAEHKTIDVERAARKWLKSLTTQAITLDAPKEDVDAIIALLKERFPKTRQVK